MVIQYEVYRRHESSWFYQETFDSLDDAENFIKAGFVDSVYKIEKIYVKK